MQEPKHLMHNIRHFAKENQFNRLLLLRLLYDIGSGKKCRIAIEFLRAPEWDDYEIVEAGEYLKEEGLVTIENEKTDSFPPNPPYFTITHKGIREVEKTIENPQEATQHFPATIIQHFNANVGSVQTGSHSSAVVQQSMGYESSEVADLVEVLRSSFKDLPPKERNEGLEVLEGLQEEVEAAQPRHGRLKAYLAQASSFALKVGAQAVVSHLTDKVLGNS